MSEELVVRQTDAVAQQAPSNASSVLGMLQSALTRGDVPAEKIPEVLTAAFDFQLKVDAVEAERKFNLAFSAALLEMPKVKKNGKIEMGAKGEMRFATYEDIDAAIRPIEIKYGFSRSFTTAPCETGVMMTLHLKHSGHEVTSTMMMPPDTGAGRNGMQARGSAASYAKRYLTLDVWNIVTQGADNDGATAEPISQEQADQIEDMLAQCGMDTPDGRKKFLANPAVNAKSVKQIQQHQFSKIMGLLQQKARQA